MPDLCNPGSRMTPCCTACEKFVPFPATLAQIAAWEYDPETKSYYCPDCWEKR